MSTVEEIERAITELSPVELTELRRWLEEYQESLFDSRIAADAAAGRLDALADEALEEFRAGRCREL